MLGAVQRRPSSSTPKFDDSKLRLGSSAAVLRSLQPQFHAIHSIDTSNPEWMGTNGRIRNINASRWQAGYFAHSLNAYGRTGQECPRCGGPIRRAAFMNRSSQFCPRCQRRC